MEGEQVRRHFLSNCSTYLFFRYQSVSPVKFRVGDIVEAQLSFVMIPLRPSRIPGFHSSQQPPRQKFLLVLRALALLDSAHVTVRHLFISTLRKAQENNQKSLQAQSLACAQNKENKRTVLKRKSGYGGLEEARKLKKRCPARETAEQLREMSLDEC